MMGWRRLLRYFLFFDDLYVVSYWVLLGCLDLYAILLDFFSPSRHLSTREVCLTLKFMYHFVTRLILFDESLIPSDIHRNHTAESFTCDPSSIRSHYVTVVCTLSVTFIVIHHHHRLGKCSFRPLGLQWRRIKGCELKRRCNWTFYMTNEFCRIWFWRILTFVPTKKENAFFQDVNERKKFQDIPSLSVGLHSNIKRCNGQRKCFVSNWEIIEIWDSLKRKSKVEN